MSRVYLFELPSLCFLSRAMDYENICYFYFWGHWNYTSGDEWRRGKVMINDVMKE
jgi:hypothetical protein